VLLAFVCPVASVAQAALNSLPPPAIGGVACPGDTAPTQGLFFHYPDGMVVLVTYSAGAAPCAYATNQRRTALMTEQVQRVIMGAVGRG
jgi:hypothetical protein